MLSTPAEIMLRLEEIDNDLAERLPSYEKAAEDHFRAKRDKEKAHATAFLTNRIDAAGKPLSVSERNAIADAETATMGAEHEAIYEARKSAVRVLETRATIGASLLKVQK